MHYARISAVTLALTAAFSLSLQAQVMGGPRLGVAVANLSGDDLGAESDSRTGVVVGWSFGFDVGDRWGIQPEFHYAASGASGSLFDIDTEVKLNYLQIPLLLRVDLTEGTRVVPSLLVGPTIGVNLSCKVEATAGPVTGERDCEDAGGGVKPIDAGISAGLALGVDMGGWELSADGRYNVGLTDVLETVDAQNRAFWFTVGASFPLTR